MGLFDTIKRYCWCVLRLSELNTLKQPTSNRTLTSADRSTSMPQHERAIYSMKFEHQALDVCYLSKLFTHFVAFNFFHVKHQKTSHTCALQLLRSDAVLIWGRIQQI